MSGIERAGGHVPLGLDQLGLGLRPAGPLVEGAAEGGVAVDVEEGHQLVQPVGGEHAGVPSAAVAGCPGLVPESAAPTNCRPGVGAGTPGRPDRVDAGVARYAVPCRHE